MSATRMSRRADEVGPTWRPRSSTWPKPWCRPAASTPSATPTWRTSSAAPRPPSTTTSPASPSSARPSCTRYAERFLDALGIIETGSDDGPTRLSAYADLYLDVLRQRRMCLCGILAAEYATLPDSMQRVVRHFFEANETWLTRILQHGKQQGSLNFEGPPLRNGTGDRQQPGRSHARSPAVRRPRTIPLSRRPSHRRPQAAR